MKRLFNPKKSCLIPFVTTGLNARTAGFSILSLILFFFLALPPAARAGSTKVSSDLSATANGLVFDTRTQHQLDSSFESNYGYAGPVIAAAEAGAMVSDDVDEFNAGFYQYAIAAQAFAKADYGVNGARAGNNAFTMNAAVPGYTLAFYAAPFTNVSADSRWRDGFVINGGTGWDTATVNLLLDGRFVRSLGMCALCTPPDFFLYVYPPSLEVYMANLFAAASYGLKYNDFVHAGGETGYEQSVLLWSRDAATSESNFSEGLTGGFAFEYGVPFMLTSYLSTDTTGHVTADFSSTATLSLFTLPPGASLAADSGSYNVVTAVAADFDRDRDVDSADFGLFWVCLEGPSVSPAPPECDRTDLNDDGRTDLGDFARFQTAFDGP